MFKSFAHTTLCFPVILSSTHFVCPWQKKTHIYILTKKSTASQHGVRSRGGGGLSDGDGDDGGQLSDGRGVVLLHPHQPPQDVVAVPRPGVHLGVLEPVGDVALGTQRT